MLKEYVPTLQAVITGWCCSVLESYDTQRDLNQPALDSVAGDDHLDTTSVCCTLLFAIQQYSISSHTSKTLEQVFLSLCNSWRQEQHIIESAWWQGGQMSRVVSATWPF